MATKLLCSDVTAFLYGTPIIIRWLFDRLHRYLNIVDFLHQRPRATYLAEQPLGGIKFVKELRCSWAPTDWAGGLAYFLRFPAGGRLTEPNFVDSSEISRLNVHFSGPISQNHRLSYYKNRAKLLKIETKIREKSYFSTDFVRYQSTILKIHIHSSAISTCFCHFGIFCMPFRQSDKI